jgi:cupin 2 domain-containing protein
METGNLFVRPSNHSAGEFIEELLRGSSFRLERIVSTGQVTPPGQWYDQPEAEWVVLLSGAARLQFEDESDVRELLPGDYLLIAPHRRHRVEWTDQQQPTVWLAIYF